MEPYLIYADNIVAKGNNDDELTNQSNQIAKTKIKTWKIFQKIKI